ncbi:MAG: hypothetical protein WBE44_04810 [Terriglobales bacterium]
MERTIREIPRQENPPVLNPHPGNDQPLPDLTFQRSDAGNIINDESGILRPRHFQFKIVSESPVGYTWRVALRQGLLPQRSRDGDLIVRAVLWQEHHNVT